MNESSSYIACTSFSENKYKLINKLNHNNEIMDSRILDERLLATTKQRRTYQYSNTDLCCNNNNNNNNRTFYHSNNELIDLRRCSQRGDKRIIGTLLALFIMFTLANRPALSIAIKRVEIPSVLKIGDSATMICNYELLGQEKLYALKWYRDGKEFYRFLPSEKVEERKQAFRTEGIHVDLLRSTDKMVTLNNVTLKTGGNFKCEAITDLTFLSVFKESKMNINNQQKNRIVHHQQQQQQSNSNKQSSSSSTGGIRDLMSIVTIVLVATISNIITLHYVPLSC